MSSGQGAFGTQYVAIGRVSLSHVVQSHDGRINEEDDAKLGAGIVLSSR